MYSTRLINHFQNPRNVGVLPPPAIQVEVSNPACGDMLRLSVRWEQNRVAEVRYQTRGCVASIAAGSALTELMVGKPLEEAERLNTAALEAALDGLAPESKHAAVLAIDAVQSVIQLARQQHLF